MNITIMEKVCSMLSNAKLTKSFWAEVATTFCFLINGLPQLPLTRRHQLRYGLVLM